MVTTRFFLMLCYFQYCSSECKLTYVTKDGIIRNRDCFSWKEWSDWSECKDGTKQRRRTCHETSKDHIEKQSCFPKFHATYGKVNKGPQFELPRTLSEATNNNYKKLSPDCSTNPSETPGIRAIAPEKDKVLIYDKNGYIAGMHSLVPITASADSNQFDYPKSGYYRKTTIDSIEYWMTTAYFLDPNQICSKGRTDQEFKSEGTIRKLIFQIGPLVSDLYEAPLSEELAMKERGLIRFKCFPNMGYHYGRISADTNSEDCDKYTLGYLIYHHGILHAFSWAHVLKTSASDFNFSPWEFINEAIFRAVITDDPPKCYIGQDGLLVSPGIVSQHIYLRDWKQINCQ